MNFGEALELVKKGKLVQRQGWNGKDMFVFMRQSITMHYWDVLNLKSLPQRVKSYLCASDENEDELDIVFSEYLCLKDVDGTIVNGWLASQSDMLEEDWVEVN